MKKLLLFILFCFSLNAYAEQKYNPYNNEYEIVPDNFEPTYNPFSGEYEMAPQGASPEFNPYSGEWEFAK